MSVTVKSLSNSTMAEYASKVVEWSPMAAEMRSQRPTGPRSARSYDLRERKRTRTRLMIQTEAVRLFTEKGYGRTTVEEIADAAAISPRTFFRYFPAKEDVVMWDEYDPLALDLRAARAPHRGQARHPG